MASEFEPVYDQALSRTAIALTELINNLDREIKTTQVFLAQQPAGAFLLDTFAQREELEQKYTEINRLRDERWAIAVAMGANTESLKAVLAGSFAECMKPIVEKLKNNPGEIIEPTREFITVQGGVEMANMAPFGPLDIRVGSLVEEDENAVYIFGTNINDAGFKQLFPPGYDVNSTSVLRYVGATGQVMSHIAAVWNCSLNINAAFYGDEILAARPAVQLAHIRDGRYGVELPCVLPDFLNNLLNQWTLGNELLVDFNPSLSGGKVNFQSIYSVITDGTAFSAVDSILKFIKKHESGRFAGLNGSLISLGAPHMLNTQLRTLSNFLLDTTVNVGVAQLPDHFVAVFKDTESGRKKFYIIDSSTTTIQEFQRRYPGVMQSLMSILTWNGFEMVYITSKNTEQGNESSCAAFALSRALSLAVKGLGALSTPTACAYLVAVAQLFVYSTRTNIVDANTYNHQLIRRSLQNPPEQSDLLNDALIVHAYFYENIDGFYLGFRAAELPDELDEYMKNVQNLTLRVENNSLGPYEGSSQLLALIFYGALASFNMQNILAIFNRLQAIRLAHPMTDMINFFFLNTLANGNYTRRVTNELTKRLDKDYTVNTFNRRQSVYEITANTLTVWDVDIFMPGLPSEFRSRYSLNDEALHNVLGVAVQWLSNFLAEVAIKTINSHPDFLPDVVGRFAEVCVTSLPQYKQTMCDLLINKIQVLRGGFSDPGEKIADILRVCQ